MENILSIVLFSNVSQEKLKILSNSQILEKWVKIFKHLKLVSNYVACPKYI